VPERGCDPGLLGAGPRHAGGRRSGARPDGERLDDVAVLVKVDLQQQDVRVVVAQLTQLPPPPPPQSRTSLALLSKQVQSTTLSRGGTARGARRTLGNSARHALHHFA